ncbi:MAG: leucine-rich repeat domain-containing protein [Holosporales bacterium]|jgi:hypothetical protein|nr:leucine-rich repeat domain-containing protein [Holosporales bacterium]
MFWRQSLTLLFFGSIFVNSVLGYGTLHKNFSKKVPRSQGLDEFEFETLTSSQELDEFDGRSRIFRIYGTGLGCPSTCFDLDHFIYSGIAPLSFRDIWFRYWICLNTPERDKDFSDEDLQQLDEDEQNVSSSRSAISYTFPHGMTHLGWRDVPINKDITEFLIPRTVEVIERGAFQGMVNVHRVVFEAGSVASIIKDFAFSDCCNLEFFACPASVRHIGIESFSYCKNIYNFLFEENSQLRSIGHRAFFMCGGLRISVI